MSVKPYCGECVSYGHAPQDCPQRARRLQVARDVLFRAGLTKESVLALRARYEALGPFEAYVAREAWQVDSRGRKLAWRSDGQEA